MSNKNKLLPFLILIIFLSFITLKKTNFEIDKNFNPKFVIFSNCFNNNGLGNKLINSLDEDFYKLEIYYVNLSREGPIEIGENIEITGLYSLNYSPIKYGVTENWMDIGDYPENFHNIPFLVENYTFSRNVTIDPQRFEVNETNPLYGKIMLKIESLETSYVYSKQKKSNNSIKIYKSKINFTILNQVPEIILSSKMTNISFNFFNRHNSDFKFSNSYVQFLLYDPENELVQNENLSTSIDGNINLTLRTNSYQYGGNYTLKIITQENNLYEETNHTISFKVFNESAVFNTTISKNNVYTSVPNDPKILELFAELQFNSKIIWNSSFSYGNFTKIENFTYISNFSSPLFANNYTIDIWAEPYGTNSTLNRKINLIVLPRPIKISLKMNKLLFSNNIEIKAIINDNITDYPILNNQKFKFFFLNNSIWQLIGISNSYNGVSNLIWNPPLEYLTEKLIVKVELFNSSIYQQNYCIKDIRFTELKVLTISEIKILNLIPIFVNLQVLNGTNSTNEHIEILIHGLKMYDMNIKPNSFNLIYLIAPPFEIRLNFIIIYKGNSLNLNSNFIFEVNVISDILKLVIGNVPLIIALFISSFFTIIYLKNRNSNQLNKLKIMNKI